MTEQEMERLEYDLIVIGGGSAGLAAAIAARESGVERILVLEKENFLGGILLQCIHNGFGLHRFQEELTGPEYAERFVRKLYALKIEYRVKTMALKLELDPNGLKKVYFSSEKEGYQLAVAPAIITATGCSERTRGAIRIPGDRPAGIMTAGLAQQYLNIGGYFVGKRVFILGSGDIGLIMARRMTLEGSKVLGVAELAPYSNGLNRNIVQCLNDFNIPLYLSHTVKEIRGKDRLEQIVVAQVDAQFQFIPGTERVFDVDTLLLSVGLIPSNPLLTQAGVALHPKTGGPLVDENLQTTIPGIFACGNSLHVHDLVDFVSLEGETAGQAAAQYLNGNFEREDSIQTQPGPGVGYVLPSRINVKIAADSTVATETEGETAPESASGSRREQTVTLKLRVKRPFKKSALIIKLNDKLIKRIPKLYMVPAEMENISISRTLLHDNFGTLTIEVEEL